MADDEKKLDTAYLRSLIPELTEDGAKQNVDKLRVNDLYALSQLRDVTDEQLKNIGITLGVRSALRKQGTQQRAHLLSSTPHRPTHSRLLCCLRAHADAAVAPVIATSTGG
jgi:hypothetical protein